MQGTQYFGSFRDVATFTSMTFVLSGCLMQDEIEDTSVDPTLDSEFELSGSVGDGPVVGATMRVYRNDGAVLNEFESDASAGYNILVRTKGKYYPLTIDARNGIDVVTNANPDFALIGAALEPSRKYVVNVNPFSTLAMEIAQDLPGGHTKSNIYAAQDIAVAAMNSGLVSLASSGPMTTTIDSGNVAEIVKSSEALGEIVRRTRDWLAVSGVNSNGDTTIQTLGSDLIDSMIDGVGGPRTDTRTAAIATIVSTQALLETASNELHVNGTDATSSLEAAIQMMNVGMASPALGELAMTSSMLRQINVGLAAADAVSTDTRVTDLRQTVAGIQPGLQPELVRGILPQDYRQILDDVLTLVAVGGESTITTINDVVRSGGEVPDNNRAPTISGSPASFVEAGSMYQFLPSATDADGDPLTFTIANRPDWATFNVATGFLSGMTAEADVGTYPGIVIGATDGQTTTSLQSFTISVASSFNNTAPEISGTPSTNVLEGESYSFTPVASDADQDPLTFGITGRPPWATFNTSNGEISGTPNSSDVGVHGGIAISVSDGSATTSLLTFSIAVQGIVANAPPTILGTPSAVVTANSAYDFTPNVSDADNDPLSFAIVGLPAWATFSASNGRISGTPGDGHIGNYAGIVITVSDGIDSATLGPFSILVEAVSLGSVTISWTPPTQNEDGTPLSDLAGYKIYWGTTPGTYPNSVTINNPGLTTYVIDNLAPGTYEFVSTSFNAAGTESRFSNTAARSVP